MKRHIVEITVPHFGCACVKDFIDSIAGCRDKITLRKTPLSRRVVTEATIVVDFGTRDYAVATLTKRLDEMFKPTFLKYSCHEREMFETKAEELAYRVKHHDWEYAYSDDHRVYSGGEANWNCIKALIPQVANAREVWAANAPSTHSFPQC